jgi:hypothetical protein
MAGGAHAVADWDEKTDATKDENGEPFAMAAFAMIHEIPSKTFAKYAWEEDTSKSKRRVLGSHVGKPQLLSSHQSQFVADVVVRADRRRNVIAIVFFASTREM